MHSAVQALFYGSALARAFIASGSLGKADLKPLAGPTSELCILRSLRLILLIRPAARGQEDVTSTTETKPWVGGALVSALPMPLQAVHSK